MGTWQSHDRAPTQQGLSLNNRWITVCQTRAHLYSGHMVCQTAHILNGYNMVTVVTIVALVAYNTTHDHGSGLSLSPVHAQTYIKTMLNTILCIYITRNMPGRAGWAAFPKALLCHGDHGVDSC
jgi:hypothetical protein